MKFTFVKHCLQVPECENGDTTYQVFCSSDIYENCYEQFKESKSRYWYSERNSNTECFGKTIYTHFNDAINSSNFLVSLNLGNIKNGSRCQKVPVNILTYV